MRDVLYDLLVWFLRLVTRIFFRSIEVSGLENVPADGAVVLVGNHPNSLLDPVLISTTCGRRVRFAAKEPLFKGPLRPFLWVLGSVPVKRRQDEVKGAPEDAVVDGAGASRGDPAPPARVDNNAAFDALTAVLKNGEAFGIFPEGISHTRPELAPLKSGAARIVLTAAASSSEPVRVVPCGLSYRQRDRMRSRVLVQFGTPIVVGGAVLAAAGIGAGIGAGPDVDGDGAADAAADGTDWVKRFEQDPTATAKALTSTINTALRAQTINATDFETLRVLDTVRKLYRPEGLTLTLAAQAELMRRFIEHWERLKDNPDIKSFYADVSSYLDELAALGISDRELRGTLTWWEKALRVVQHGVFLVVLVPLALPGFFIHLPVLIAAVLAARTLTSRGDVRATIQMCVVTSLTFAAYAAAAAAAWQASGPTAAASTLALLILSGAATLRVLDGQSRVRRGLWTFLTLLHLDRELLQLRIRRDALRGRLLGIVDTYIPADLQRVVPRAEHGDAPEAWIDDEE